MSSYHLPIILGKNQSERIVIVHLVDDTEVYEENRVVITSLAGSNVPLFQIYDRAQLIGLGEDNLIKPSFDKGSNLIEVSIDGKPVIPRHSNSFWLYRIGKAEFDGVVSFQVTINDEEGEHTYQGSLHIVRPSANQKVMRINADLGSDATQINFFIPGKGAASSQKFNIIECFKDAYFPDRKYDLLTKPDSKEPLFIQQEKGSKAFYKTGNITFHVDGFIDEPLNSPQTFINYINVSASGKNEPANSSIGADTWDQEAGFNRKLINIKMLYAHSDLSEVTDPVDDIVFHSKSTTKAKSVSDQFNLLQVLQAIYKQLITVTANGAVHGSKLFSILLLVPNIYNQENIDLLLYEVNKMNRNPEGRKYDFRIISESDSAFVGIKEAKLEGAKGTILGSFLSGVKKQKQKDMFLIIDAGKGTTDYSIIRYDSESSGTASSNMFSLRRGGIVGAGGAIDYVFARILARQIYDHIPPEKKEKISMDVFVDRFMHMVERLSPRDQDKMMLFVELLKKHYNNQDNNSIAKVPSIRTCFDTGDAKTIVNRLLYEPFSNADFNAITSDEEAWKIVSQWVWDGQSFDDIIKDDKEEVDWVCSAIAHTIIDDMIFVNKDSSVTNSIDYVIFNGRSFLFEPLKKAFDQVIKAKKDIYPENFDWWDYLPTKLSRNEDKMNLKIAPLAGFNMKAVSVQFEDHDLGVNCNSDLCCMDGIKMEGSDIFGLEQFYDGFSVDNDAESIHHYIGYVSDDTANSFAPHLSQGVNAAKELSATRKKLVLMTLFPVRYEPVRFDSGLDEKGNLSYTTSASSKTDEPNNSPTPTPTDNKTPADNSKPGDFNDL